MELQIVTKNGTAISEAIEDYARKRISKMDRYLPGVDEGKVEISDEGPKTPDRRFEVQVTLNGLNGILIRAQEHGDDPRTAIDRVVDALASRVTRYKGRRFGKTKDSVRTMEPALEPLEAPASEPEEPHRIVKSKRFTLKPMDLDEATDQMELLGHDFYLFINSETGQANVLYRRKDGNYGLIEPANM
jgi:putative sigma-54 modulation protein